MPWLLRMEVDSERVALGKFRRARKAHEFGLVALSQGSAYWVEEIEGAFVLFVEPEKAARVRAQLQLYTHERRHWPPRMVQDLAEHPSQLTGPLIWVVSLFFAYALSSRDPQMYELGKASSQAIFDGEVYRAFSALLLHADFGHLASNMGFGALFLYWLSRQCGTWTALIGSVLAGTLGNLLNAAIYYPEPHFSVGASTAVFGIIGMLVMVPVGAQLLAGQGWRSMRFWLAPLVIGSVLLAWFGSGNERTDVSAHLCGFVCALPLGWLAGRFPAGFDRKRLQRKLRKLCS